MFVSVSESEVPKEKTKPATVKKGTDIEIVKLCVCKFFIFFVNNIDP